MSMSSWLTATLRPAASSLDSFLKRTLGAQRLASAVERGRPIKIVVGAYPRILRPPNVQEGWIPTDIAYLNILKRDHWDRFFQPSSIDTIVAEHVWEHLEMDQAILAASHCYEFLRPGGHVRVAVPDGNFPDPAYIDRERPGGSGLAGHEHRILFTCDTLREVFEVAGFDVTPIEYFDEFGQFHRIAWSETDGFIRRSQEHDPRNSSGELRYTSVIIDATKPQDSRLA